LIIVGGGPERTRLLALARRLELADRVQILEPMPQRRLAALYSAADVLLLASSREGWPNVLLESMACGTPVVATDVGGVREIVSTPSVGEVVSDRSIDSMVAAVKRLLSRTSDRYLIRQYAEQFSWDAISRGQLEIFQTLRAARA
jgi:glycosyltransferase involved in cell wall biosynthesis